MGAAVGEALLGSGHAVLWASAGRSAATAGRAARFEDAGSVAALARRAGAIVSVCPPHAALDVARACAGFRGLYVDANAIAPETARAVAAALPEARFADGGIVGPPPHEAGTTRLYLSGGHAGEAAALFAGSPLEARVVADASALKAAYAAWSKGSAALILAIHEVARAYGVDDALAEEWRTSVPELHERLDRARRSADAKGWRWIGEMEEIARAFAAAGQPPGFHEAAAEVYRRRAGGDEPPAA